MGRKLPFPKNQKNVGGKRMRGGGEKTIRGKDRNARFKDTKPADFA